MFQSKLLTNNEQGRRNGNGKTVLLWRVKAILHAKQGQKILFI